MAYFIIKYEGKFMKCSNCGEEISDGIKFCPNCGENLEKMRGTDSWKIRNVRTVVMK